EELKTKVSEAEESLEKRLTFLADEEKSMNKAKESVATFDEIIEKADEEKVKAEITELRDSVNNRYDLHSDFVENYTKLTDLQKELYGMLVDEETDVSKLQEKVIEVNKQNETVKEIINSFNEATGIVNKLKEDLFNKLAEK
ncbi:YkyA family protein, partial [Microvirga sp. 3-52]|nr:YkyA family protein [Microvirga sp. 3-52]